MILESFDKAEDDFKERQVREARVEADTILAATEKARRNEAMAILTDEERAAIDRSVNELLVVYHGDDHLLIRAKIDQLNEATQRLAETIMNTAVAGVLKGTKTLMPKLTWQNLDDIALELYEKFPDLDPTHIRFTDLHKWITELEDFDDDPLKSNEAKLERIQMAWLEEFQDNQ